VFVLGDIRKIPSSGIPDFDILCAGFPCQPFSIAGVSKKKSLGMPHGFEDKTQGTLFYEIARILRNKKPEAYFLENVSNLEHHDQGRTFTVIRETLEELGYSFYYRKIDARHLLPQHRERVFMIGFRDRTLDFVFPEIPELNPKLKDILEKNVPEKYTLTDHLWKYLQDYAKKHRAKGNGFGFGLADPEGRTRTLSARYYKDGSEILIPQEGKTRAGSLRGSAQDFRVFLMILRFPYQTRKHTGSSGTPFRCRLWRCFPRQLWAHF